MCRAIGFREGDRVLATIPLCHSYGLEHGLLAPMAAGATVCLAPFNTDVILRELASGSVMIFPGVPSVFEMLAQLHPPSEMRFSSLHAAYSAGAPLPRAVFDAFENAFGVRVAQLYGATEVGSVTYNDPAQADFDPASVGRGMRGVEIRICRIDDASAPLPAGEEGQVCIRAESMFDGYVDESETALIDGFFPTADLGHMDARGNLTITGRLKLLIDIGGLKVNPMEVEQVIQQHPSVAACVVVPIRQSQTVFRLKAIVTPRDAGHPPDADELRRFARERLTSYKVPRLIEVRPALPRSATGKVLRHQVEAS
jgi:long-chain acyl-CoA synthetase